MDSCLLNLLPLFCIKIIFNTSISYYFLLHLGFCGENDKNYHIDDVDVTKTEACDMSGLKSYEHKTLNPHVQEAELIILLLSFCHFLNCS